MAPVDTQSIPRNFSEESDSDSETVVGDVFPNEIDIPDGYSDTSDVEIIEIKNNPGNSPPLNPSSSSPQPLSSPRKSKDLAITVPWVSQHSYRIDPSTKIVVGTTVELRDKVNRSPNELHSGDFLRVKHIIRNLRTNQVKLRGFLMRRTKYHGQIFDWKLNELVMILAVTGDDGRSPFIQGMEEYSMEDVIGIRECVVTSKPYPLLSFREGPQITFLQGMSEEETKGIIFQQGRLVCRRLHIRVVEATGKSYSGELRGFYDRESDAPASHSSSLRGSSVETPIHADCDEDVVLVSSHKRNKSGKRPIRSPSIEVLAERPSKRRIYQPEKSPRYSFADMFCGAGGASQGAVQADLCVKFGLDMDQAAIQAYALNHPGAHVFPMDAHDFPSMGIPYHLCKIDILHLSPPCCYWSPAHTNPGKNDQLNYEAIYTVGPILEKLKPRIATLEQTYGLLTQEQHSKNFKLLLNDIQKAGYNVRYKIQDMSEFGLPQRRKRLLVIAARHGIPLPPFPKPTHGPPGSGLKRYTSVYDALKPLDRLNPRMHIEDDYHQPNSMRRINKPPYNPENSFLKGCITTSGGENYHYSGLRRYTPREMALLQSFLYDYEFCGNNGEVMKQIGNAFPPIMAEALFRSCAQTLEAFGNGLIQHDAYIDDLDAFLIPEPAASPNFFSAPSSSTANGSSGPPKYRYLTRLATNSTPTSIPGRQYKQPTLWDHKARIEPHKQAGKKRQKSSSFFGSFGNLNDDIELTEEEKAWIAKDYNDPTILE